MRRCLIGDLIEAATVVAASDFLDKSAYCQRLITQADAAHRYAKRYGRAHPLWGNGSLMARALIERPAKIWPHSSAPFLHALSLITQTLAARKTTLQPE
jgi:hypothetical protein